VVLPDFHWLVSRVTLPEARMPCQSQEIRVWVMPRMSSSRRPSMDADVAVMSGEDVGWSKAGFLVRLPKGPIKGHKGP
jgi:hypothetical protein